MKNENPELKGGLINSRSLKIALVIAVLLLLIYAVVNIYSWKKDKSVSKSLPSQVEKTNIDFSKNPTRFPSNIPIESGAKLTQNYNATSPNGQFQATRTFITEKTLAENIEFYTDLLKKDDWKTNLSNDDPTFKRVTGSKNNMKLNISADENKATKTRTVTISYIEL